MACCAPRKGALVARAYRAASAGDGSLRSIQGIIRRHPGLAGQQDEEGRTLLHWCVEKGDLQGVNILLTAFPRGRWYDIQDRTGLTALHIAATAGNPAILKALLRRGVNPALQDVKGYCAIHYAAENTSNSVPLLDSFLAHDVQSVLLETSRGSNPLMLVISRGDVNAVRLILGRVSQSFLHTPLVCEEAASPERDTDPPRSSEAVAFSELFQRRDHRQRTVFHLSAMLSSSTIIRLLLEVSNETRFSYCGAGRLPIHYACLSGCVKSVQLLAAIDPKLLSTVDGGRTRNPVSYPLHYAVASGSLPTVRYVLQNGGACACNLHDHNNHTSLHCAVRQNASDIVKALVHEGANPNVPGTEGMTPTVLAATLGHAHIFFYLVRKGGDPLRPYKGSFTSLHMAVKNGHYELLEMMLERGMAPKMTEAEHRQLVRLATRYQHLGIAKLLVSRIQRVFLEPPI